MRRGKPEFIGGDGGLKLPSGPAAKLAGWGAITAVAVVALTLLYMLFCVYVGPSEWGVKVVRIGLNKGIQDIQYEAGFVFRLPFNQVYTLPRNTQVLEMTGFSPRQGANLYYDEVAKIQTSDGFYVDVDVSILYRIADPVEVVKVLGPGTRFIENGILPKAEPILKQTLGQLTTEEFYNSPLRVAKAELARDQLHEELSPRGLEIEHVLIRYFQYSDRIQENIEAKKLQDQLVFTNQSKRAAAEQQQILSRVQQRGEMEVEVTLEQGRAYSVQKSSEKELYVRKREAEADLLVQLAEAERERLRSAAMQIDGADRAVALQMASVLNGLEMVFLPAGGQGGLNPLDLATITALFGVEPGGQPIEGQVIQRAREELERQTVELIEAPDPVEVPAFDLNPEDDVAGTEDTAASMPLGAPNTTALRPAPGASAAEAETAAPAATAANVQENR